MGVNQFDMNYQAYQLLNEIHEQATGQKSIAPVNTGEFVSMATATLASGYENTLNAIDLVLARTIVAVRPYNRKFAGLENTAERWGAVIRKINFADRDAEADQAYTTVDGQSIDPFVVKKPNILTTRYIGSAVYQQHYTRFKYQLDVAFQNEANFIAFIEGMLTHMSNEWEQWLEGMTRSTLLNFVGAKAETGNGVIHLLTEYNTLTGASPALTVQDIWKPDNVKPFFQWVYGRIDELTNLMSERSELFHVNVTGKEIMRHTPLQYQRVFLLAGVMAQIQATVKSNTYHPDFLQLAETESVSYWQDINSPDEIQVVPSYMDAAGAVQTGSSQSLSQVVGVIVDRDAVGYNVALNEIEPVIYNPAGSYWNIFHKARFQYQNDLTENGLVLILD